MTIRDEIQLMQFIGGSWWSSWWSNSCWWRLRSTSEPSGTGRSRWPTGSRRKRRTSPHCTLKQLDLIKGYLHANDFKFSRIAKRFGSQDDQGHHLKTLCTAMHFDLKNSQFFKLLCSATRMSRYVLILLWMPHRSVVRFKLTSHT